MSTKFDLMRHAMNDARATLRAADSQADEMARLLTEHGRLRAVNPYRLKRLKKSLKTSTL